MTDTALILLFENGNGNRALTYINDAWIPSVLYYLKKRYQAEIAEEACNEALYALYRNIHKYDARLNA